MFAPRTRNSSVPSADRKSTRLNSSHQIISYAVFCLKKKKKEKVVRNLVPFLRYSGKAADMQKISSLREIVENREEMLIGRFFFHALELNGEFNTSK